VKAFAETCDVVTVEIEHIDVEALRELSAAGVDVQPTPETLATIQDKYAQKGTLQRTPGSRSGRTRIARMKPRCRARRASLGFRSC
jgi:phosphoribosylaminoimidazole carboxylase (NCAIR synthetase)